MTCEEAQGKITPFINDRLSVPELEEFVAHIRTCPVCKEELEVYYALMTAMKQLDSGSDLSDNYMMELEAKLLEAEGLVRRSKRAHRGRKQVFFLILIGAVLLTGVSASLGEEKGEEPPLRQEESSFFLGNDMFYRQDRNLIEEWRAGLEKEGGRWPGQKPFQKEEPDKITDKEPHTAP